VSHAASHASGGSDALSLAASQITSGVLATARLASSGTASSSTYLRGDGTWSAVSVTPTTATPSALTADQNDWAIGTGDIQRISGTAARNITGIASTATSPMLLINVGSYTLTLKHQSTSSSSANRFTTAWAGDCTLAANGGSALVVYDATTGTWRVM
jgi:hypothetical protein